MPPDPDDPSTARSLRRIKVVHTVVWAIVAGAIVLLFPAIASERWDLFAALHLAIVPEVVVLALNRWTCPLTPVAARYTDDRSPNFDIYLPAPIAAWNKVIFTALLLAAWTWAIVRVA